MAALSPERIADILGSHFRWLYNEPLGERADLRSADLRGADLRGADLRSANLRGANLGGADLRCADLGGADLRSANLSSADLRGADLRSANLRGANLVGADLRSADLGRADLYGADLRSADLRSADLGGADLRGADLRRHPHRADRPDRLAGRRVAGNVGQGPGRRSSRLRATGCFAGTLATFEAAVDATYGMTGYGAHYHAAIAMIRVMQAAEVVSA